MRRFYCLECGKELKWTRLSLRKRGEIIETIAPHECEEGYVANITDSDKPLTEQVVYEGEAKSGISQAAHEPGDRRPPDKVKSTAPAGAFAALQNELDSNHGKD